MLQAAVFESSFGVGAVVVSSDGVLEVFPPFGCKTVAEAVAELSSRHEARISSQGLAAEAARQLADYFRGELKVFSLPLDLGHLSSFARAVCLSVIAIPYGESRSYGQVAAEVGSRGAARAVGAVMAANRLPIIIPCHRVVASDGSMRGYSAAGGTGSKRALLSLESMRR